MLLKLDTVTLIVPLLMRMREKLELESKLKLRMEQSPEMTYLLQSKYHSSSGLNFLGTMRIV